MNAFRFLLNGEPRAIEGTSPTMTVLDWLRGEARLTGTKEGCAEGDCGACTIVVGRPHDGGLRYDAVNSCLMTVGQLDGSAVVTVEGLAEADGTLHPVQQAMIDTDATQCGFCTPGFVMAMFAYQHDGKAGERGTSDGEFHEALAGNLCRCTGYRAIIDAMRKVARVPADRFDEQAPQQVQTLKQWPAIGEVRANGQMFLAPRSLAELVEARTAHPDAKLLAGGTDIGLRLSKDREVWPVVISTGAATDIKFVRETADALEIGGAATYTQALPFLAEHFPAFADLVRRIGSRQIRNLGTFAGNMVTASPIGDTPPCLMALGAHVTLASRGGQRILPVSDFITGYRTTALAPGEVVASIRIPYLKPEQKFAVYKVSKRFDQDISTVIAACTLSLAGDKPSDLRLVFGGMAATTKRASATEAALTQRPWTAQLLADVDALIARDFQPMSDQRGSGAYRLRAAAGLVRRFQMETTTATPIRVEAL